MLSGIYVNTVKKRGRIIAYRAFVFCVVILGTLFSYSEASASTWLNVASTTLGATAGGYVGMPFTIESDLVGIKYAGAYNGGTCNKAIYIFDWDITASSSIGILTSLQYAFGSGVSDNAGGCVYTISSVRTSVSPYVRSSTTTGQYIPAGNYWALMTSADTYRGVDGGVTNARVYDSPSGPWLGAYSLETPSLYFKSATTDTMPAPSYTPDTSTRIVDFAPADGAVLPVDAPVTFSLTAYVAPEDIGTYIGVRFTLHNIDQNVLLLSSLSPSDFYILDGFDATTSGDFYFESEGYTLGEGNYRIEAQIERSYLGGWVVNPFSPINDSQSHQFTVGSSTYLGNLAQTGFTDMQDFFAGASATSSLVTAGSCNPFTWETLNCLSYLLVPSGADMSNTVLGLKDMVLTRVPWGYATRVYTIFNTTATTALPTFEVNLHLGAGSLTPATNTLSFDPDDMLGGGMALVESIKDVTYGKTIREILYPIIQLIMALAVITYIVKDLLKLSHEQRSEQRRQTQTTQ